MRLALALLPLVATPALADAVTYKGTIGDRDIVLELTEPAHGAVAGRFAFLDDGISVPLNARSGDDNTFVLAEEGLCTLQSCTFDDAGVAESVPSVASWDLVLEGSRVTGTRRVNGKSKELPIEAVEVGWRPFDGDPTPGALHDNIYDAVYTDDYRLDPNLAIYETALVNVPLVTQARETLAGVDVALMVDPRTKFAFPHITGFADGAPVDAVEAILAGRHDRLSFSALDCLSSGYVGFGAGKYGAGGGSLGDYDSEVVALSYASPRLVSWTEAGSVYCGGAHPYNHFDSYTVDVEAGAPLDLSRIFSGWVASSFTDDDATVDLGTARANPDDYYWHPDEALVQYVLERIPEGAMAQELELDEACFGPQAVREQLDIRFEAGPNAVFTLSGFPHVLSMCNGDVASVPLAELYRFLTPDAVRYFPELAGQP